MRGNHRRECDWCKEPFSPRKTGGTRQKFCSRECRHAFSSASRQYVNLGLAKGWVSVDDLKLLYQRARFS